MKRSLLLTLVFAGLALGSAGYVAAHCEVPCGIYDDTHRFERMLEDQATIAKAMTSIQDLSKSFTGGADALAINQAARWVATKEQHATNTQDIIAQYFMTQRLKPGTDAASQEAYVKKLTAAHAVLVAAMKCKQTVDPANAEALRKTILDFYRAYEGKEPQIEGAKKP